MSDPEDKKPIVPPPARSRARRAPVKPLPSPEETSASSPIPGQSGVDPLVSVFEHADVKWAPADADGGEGTPIGYALALEKRES